MTPSDIAKLPYRPCVGIVLANARNEIFVGQRKDSDVAAWQMPQGGVDDGEEPEAAALRELWEETGVTADLVTIEAIAPEWLPYELPRDLVPKLWKGRFRGQTQLWFLIRFHGDDRDVNIVTEHQEFSEWRWMAHLDVLENIVPFKRDVYAKVFASFEELLS